MYYLNYFKKSAKIWLQGPTKLSENIYHNIGIINPSIGTSNLGDLIIFDAVNKNLRQIYPEAFFTNFPSHLNTDYDAKRLMSEKDFLFVAGTNLLSSNMDKYNQWKLDPEHKRFIKNKAVLMGVGWWQYQDSPNKYTRELLKSVLSDKIMHSVRDSYTLEMLNSIGIKNVINTTCPTLWGLSEEHCKKIPRQKANNVITTLTFYKKDKEKDTMLLNLLEENYEKTYVWIQGIEDLEYLKTIKPSMKNIELISPSLEAFDNLLNTHPDIEYLGTRLHAGVRALQKLKRTLILAVDNRAFEIAKDTGLNVIKREDIEKSMDFIEKPLITKITLPLANIAKWKSELN